MKRIIYSVLSLILISIGHVTAQAQTECPKYAKLVEVVQADNETVYYCKCMPGYTLDDGGQCARCSSEYFKTLMDQERAAVEGLKASQQALLYEYGASLSSDAKSFLQMTEPDLGHLLLALTSAQAKAPVLTAFTAGTAVVLLAKITKFYAQSFTCDQADEDMKIACQNAARFSQIAESKALQLKDCETFRTSIAPTNKPV